jgi:hypothetical protein
MKRFFRALKYIVISVLLLVLLSVVGLNIYYNVLRNSIANRTYPDKETLTSNLVEDELINYKINLIPYPQEIELSPGLFTFPDHISYQAPSDIRDEVKKIIDQLYGVDSEYRSSGLMEFTANDDLPLQGYTLQLKTNKVIVQYKDISGAYYALLTLRQLNTGYAGIIPNMEIADHPDLAIRGVMLDISRDKVPKLETLFGIVDILADLKYNHLELYVEGFSFAYPSFQSLWEGKETPITPEEIQALDRYCKDRFIDLVPNQNSLGHMMAWLETDQFADLAECPDGFSIFPFIDNMKTTLDPYDPHSIQLIEKMTDDMIPNFSSDYFNANLDEPFELGQCKSKGAAKEIGVGKVYLEFAGKVYDILKAHNKKMMMWGDVVLKHPEITGEIPKDIILLDWGYEAEYPFDKNAKKFKDTGLEFMVCPGTSSWTSIGGRTNNMAGNISNAVKGGVKHGAKGMLITDWGDMGHWQYLPVSYVGFVVGGGLSWNSTSYNEVLVENYLNTYVFKDVNKEMGSYAFDLGRYNQFEEIRAPNMTLVNLGFQLGLMDQVLYQTILNAFPSTFEKLVPADMVSLVYDRFELRQPYDYQGLLEYLNALEDVLNNSDMKCPQADLIKAEFKNAMECIRIGAALKHYIAQEHDMSRAAKIEYLERLRDNFSGFLVEHKRLWNSRNKSGGLDRSLMALIKVETQINDRIEILNRSVAARSWERLKNRTIAAAAAIIL